MSEFKCYSSNVEKGQTRNCLDPWTKVFLKADHQVRLCCFGPSIGDLNEQKLAEILNGPIAQAIRFNLLTGRLDQWCANCPAREETSPELLQKLVEDQLFS
jgi:MoaA/NifB/PqqE/SkfB family radical SAM enzyme